MRLIRVFPKIYFVDFFAQKFVESMDLIIVLVRRNEVNLIAKRELLRVDIVYVVLVWLLAIVSAYEVVSVLDLALITFIYSAYIRLSLNVFCHQIITSRVNRVMVCSGH
jgi:hypothetical protein